MNPRAPTVSVYIPTFNRAHMLRESIDSVLQQTFGDFEIIISDNASDDETESVVRSFDDTRIRYVKNDQNIGSRGNWNRCFALAKGEYIAILPDDDLMLPENLGRKVSVLSSRPQIGLVHSKFDIIDVDGRIVKANRDSWGGPDRTMDCLESQQEMLANAWDFVNCSTVLFRMACYHRLGQFTERLFTGWDYEYWLRIAVYYDVVFLAAPLVRYRVHGGTETEQFHGDDQHLMFRTDMKVKRLFLRNHLGCIPDGRRMKGEIWRRMGERFASIVQEMEKKGWSKARIRNLVLKDCLNFPELLWTNNVRKIVLKTLLGRNMTLKRL